MKHWSVLVVGRESLGRAGGLGPGWIDRCFCLSDERVEWCCAEGERGIALKKRERQVFCFAPWFLLALPCRLGLVSPRGLRVMMKNGWMDGWLEILLRRRRGLSCLSAPALPPWAANRMCCLCFLFFFLVHFLCLLLFSLSALVWSVLTSLSRARVLWSLVFGLWSGTRQDWTGLDRTGNGNWGMGMGMELGTRVTWAWHFSFLLFAAELYTSLRIRG